MITTSPGIGHIFPLLPTAWALRAAGHEVLFATPANADRVANAGLPVVDPAPGFDFRTLFMGFLADHPDMQRGGLELVSKLFAAVSAPSVDEVVRLATDWRPDLMIRGPLEGAGGVAASVLGVPSVVHGIGPGQVVGLSNGVANALAQAYERYGAEITTDAPFVDVSPPSLRAPGATGIPMRYVPFNGGGVLDTWLTTPRTRPRVTVTLGTVVPGTAGIGLLERMSGAAAHVDAEFVFALGGADATGLGELPANVRVVGWVPLSALLAVSDAAIHHGGAGTTMTALAAGVPQLVLPQGADQFMNADAVARVGSGEVVRAEDLDVSRLTDLLDDTVKRTAAAKLVDELAGQPSPAEVVPQLIG
ncbi:MAG TPA: nucleotide disphospho-sugar-binding domain-containing protein [Pseudonocardiaceae bacterium]|nr:nucleotide disphospho-sugar-binding domain-containing protein [Pseudonocardiaceae bacterium]